MATPPSQSVTDFIRLIEAGDFDAADERLPSIDPDGEGACRAIADLHTHRHRWVAAAEALAELRSPDAVLRRNLCRNLAALKQHRPEAYRVALQGVDDAAGDCRPQVAADGTFTVVRADANGRAVPVIHDPAAHLKAAATQLQPLMDKGIALALLSIGDGGVLAWLAANPPKLFMDRQQPLFLIEPNVSQFVACLLTQDFTGPNGPIEQARVMWYVGPRWLEAMRLDVLTDRYLIFPTVNVKQGGAASAIEPRLVDMINELGSLDSAAAADIERYYAARTAADHADALAGRAGRAPRILLLTTRFSTVLQHSTRDAADGFRRIGCETMVVIEPTPHHGLTRLAIRNAVATFKPDLVFQIDHHRYGHGDVFPASLPFVNWIQDLLPHLMTPAAGQQLTATDFVLTPSRQRWVDDFAYPERQCLEFRKLTRVPPRPPAQRADDERVVYVSNWSQSTETITNELLVGATGVTRDVIAAAAARMAALYEAGGTLASLGDVRRLLETVLKDLGATAGEMLIRQTTTRLFDRLNNLLYRQQGLAWAAASCRMLGLKLEIYGTGWDRHPRFAAHAAGPIGYGQPLEALTRQAGVNLILEPFMCLSHQRLLDALAAGGFCLVRDLSANHTTIEWIDLLARAGPDATDAKSLRARMIDADIARFDANLAECERLDLSPGRIDHVATVARLQRSGFYPARGQVIPLLDRMAFTTPDGMQRLLARASREPTWRAEIAGTQRRCVEGRYSYHAGMAQVLGFVCGRLNEQTRGRALAA